MQDYKINVKQGFELIDGEVTKLWDQAYRQLKRGDEEPKSDGNDSD